jgi:predicted Zn-dependent protease
MGEDASRALELARRNSALRPGGEERVLLAQALAKAGEITEARETLASVVDSSFRSAELFATQAVVLRALDDDAAATEAEARAQALRPDAMDQLAWLSMGLGPRP